METHPPHTLKIVQTLCKQCGRLYVDTTLSTVQCCKRNLLCLDEQAGNDFFEMVNSNGQAYPILNFGASPYKHMAI